MFRKLVSNLAFSPALVGQLGFYAKRLKKEEATRRVGLVFTALALVVQSFAVFSPPEAANASSSNDLIPGGFSTNSQYVSRYDANSGNLKDLFTVLGITRTDILNASKAQINSKGGYYSWGHNPHFSYAQGERSYTVATASGSTATFYMRPLNLWDTGANVSTGSYYNVLTGVASGPGTIKGQRFYLMFICGNLALKIIPPKPVCLPGQVGTYPNCAPACKVPGKETLPANDPNCKPDAKCKVPGKETLPANDPRCKYDPVAACTSLKIEKIANNYQFTGQALAQHGATVSAYVYTIKRDGKVIETKTVSSTALLSSYNYLQSKEGSYEVTLTIKTSLGDKTSVDCVKTFNIAPPEMCPQKPSLPKSSPECQPCPGDPTLWIKDEKCSASIVETKTAKNITQNNVDATTAIAKAGDKITYTMNVQNVGKAPTQVSITEELRDVLEYSTLVDNGGGTFDSTAKTLAWPKVTVNPGEKISRLLTVQVLDTIPAMGQGLSDKTSYDCRIDNTFGNNVTISVDCPAQKVVVEQTVNELPHTGPRENIIFAGIVFSIAAYFYARSRQVKKEIRLIRRDLSAGTI